MAAQLRDATEVMLGFARTARYAGLPAGPERTTAFLSALAQLDPLVPVDVYWAGTMPVRSGADGQRPL